MKQQIANLILKLSGWKINNNVEIPLKSVICIAPHTSNWEFPIGLLYKWSMNIRASFLMKSEWFRFPLGGFMRSLGGVPVNRSKKNSITDQVAEIFGQRLQFCIAITPEGTRQANPNWKLGYYYIAQKANVPIVLAYLDFKTKTVGTGKIIIPTDDIEKDIAEIKQFYKGINAKYPKQFAI